MKKKIFIIIFALLIVGIVFLYNFAYINVSYNTPLTYQQQMNTLSNESFINMETLNFYPVSVKKSLEITCSSNECYEFYASSMEKELDSSERSLIRLSKGSDYDNGKFIGYSLPFKNVVKLDLWFSNVGTKSISIMEPKF